MTATEQMILVEELLAQGPDGEKNWLIYVTVPGEVRNQEERNILFVSRTTAERTRSSDQARNHDQDDEQKNQQRRRARDQIKAIVEQSLAGDAVA